MSKLCELCRSIKLEPPALQLEEPFVPTHTDGRGRQTPSAQVHYHYPSYQKLDKSARKGCSLCILLRESLQSAEVLIASEPRHWGGIIIVWYRTSVTLEYQRLSSKTDPSVVEYLAKNHPSEWDQFDVRVTSPHLLKVEKRLSAYAVPGMY
jgi:hypothetical protein